MTSRLEIRALVADAGRSMRTATWTLVMFVAVCLVSACSAAPQLPSVDRQGGQLTRRVLIVYLSRTNNTKAVAEMIHEKTGGTMVALELVNPYPADYGATVWQVVKEDQTGFLPPLKTKIEHIEQYDLVFVGFPTWGMKLPPPMKSFLSHYDLRGKTVVPFNTNDGYGVGSCFDTVKSLCRGSKVLDGFSTTGGVAKDGSVLSIKGARAKEVERELDAWLKKLRVLK